MEQREVRRARIAAAIRGEVNKQKASRSALAAETGISPDTLRSRLNGKKPFYVDEFISICHALQVPVAEMLDRAGIK